MAKEKTHGIYFKVSDKERQLIEQRMAEAGVSNMSAYIRKMCLNGLIVRLDIPQIPDCSKYLKSASNNLNQIARRFNSGGGIIRRTCLMFGKVWTTAQCFSGRCWRAWRKSHEKK